MKRAGLRAALVAALSIGVACAAATAPAQADSALPATLVTSTHGSQSGVGYSASITPNRDAVVTTLDAGTFTMAEDSRAVIVTDAAGTPVGAIPLGFAAAGREITLTSTIDRRGTELTLHPTATPLHDIDAQERWNEQVQRGVFGALIGGAIGGLITLPFWIFVLPPLLGVAIGAGIGFLAAGGQPMLDAGIAYFTGQP
ncbi:hypothetical protein [Nocardia heshunensis]